jgi:hypothetical protein
MGVVSLSATFANAGAAPGAIGGVTHHPIPASEMAAIRATAAAILSLPCLIQRKTITPSGGLGNQTTWTTINNLMAGMGQPSAGILQNYASRIGSLATWQIRLPYGTDVQEQDHLIIDGETLVVQVILTPNAFASTVSLLASEVK